MDINDSFSSSYAEARPKFLDAALACGASLRHYPLPVRKGPSGEDLVTDVATLGDPKAERLMMIVSGTHGVEGYAGSGCQISLLRSGLLQEVSNSVLVLLVHAINPFGFAYMRRTNEDNIDLNRNFVNFSEQTPSNRNYAEYASRFLPAGNSLEDYDRAKSLLDREADLRGGYQFLKKALQPGQYEFPDGLYYGGHEPAWSNRTFREICRSAAQDLKRTAILDLHTGLGSSGVGELIFLSLESASKFGKHFPPPVTCAGTQGSVSANVQGPLLVAAGIELAAPTTISCALEFGTVPLKENVQTKIFENWAHRYFPPDHPLCLESERRMKDAYFCDNHDWKKNIIERTNDVVRVLNSCLTMGAK